MPPDRESGTGSEIRPGFAVYVHWPFCLSKCPYCDFNSHVRDSVDGAQWGRALVREIEDMARRISPGPVASIFFGGGTPSLMPVSVVDGVIAALDRLWGLDNDVEITLEANPTSVEAAAFRDFAAAGVNRVSLGVQALSDRDLKALGRHHTVADSVAALKLARATFRRTSFDLIYARPGQELGSWRAELAEALEMVEGHISLYQLTLEPGTAFARQSRRGDLHLPDGELTADMYELTQVLCGEAGLPAYEISNHAALGQESRHNLAYWRYGEYAGFGPGAHGRVMVDGRRSALSRIAGPEKWLAAVDARGHGTKALVALSPDERSKEMLIMGLRAREGVSRARYLEIVGRPLQGDMAPGAVGDLEAEGLLESDHAGIRATDRGRALLNSILGRLFF